MQPDTKFVDAELGPGDDDIAADREIGEPA
jgi:hypothetical protein